MGKKSIFRKIRQDISVRLRPVSVLDLESLTKVLADHERRIRKLEQYLGFELAIKEVTTKKQTNKKNKKSKR